MRRGPAILPILSIFALGLATILVGWDPVFSLLHHYLLVGWEGRAGGVSTDVGQHSGQMRMGLCQDGCPFQNPKDIRPPQRPQAPRRVEELQGYTNDPAENFVGPAAEPGKAVPI